MKIPFTVHSSAAQSFSVEAEVAGAKVAASVTGLVVELVNDAAGMSQTLRILPGDGFDDARALFVQGALVEATYAPAAAKVAAKGK